MSKLRLFSIFMMLFTLFASASAGKNISKMYTYFLGSDGTLFYIKPQKMDKAEGSVAKRKLKYDITTMSNEDSISVTAFVVTSKRFQFNEATLTGDDGNKYSSKIEILYIDPKGSNKYLNRLRFWMKRKDFDKIIDSPKPYLLNYGNDCTFKFSQKKWDEMRYILKEIFISIDIKKDN